MKNIKKDRFIMYEMFPIKEYPELYSKRGFEKSRLKFLVFPDRNLMIVMTNKEGKALQKQP